MTDAAPAPLRSARRFLPGGAGRPSDPAPTRWRYRLQRLWLTPGVRRSVRFGLPAAAAALAAYAHFSQPGRLEALADAARGMVQAVQERPEFMVGLLRIEGAGPELQADILEVLPVDLPLSQFALDLDALRAKLEELDPVAVAEVRLRSGGTLLLKVRERIPAVAWVSDDGVELLDADGYRVAALGSVDEAGALPLVSGEGADAAVGEALRLFEAAGALEERLVGLARVGARRWDVLLTGGQRILLPETEPLAAFHRALAFDDAGDVLSREVLALDLRLVDRPTLRLTEGARDELRLRREVGETGPADEGGER
jgi:cell division protein FtsQ